MKACKHKYKEEMGLAAAKRMHIANMGNVELPLTICQPVYLCLECRCLFVPQDKEYIVKDKEEK